MGVVIYFLWEFHSFGFFYFFSLLYFQFSFYLSFIFFLATSSIFPTSGTQMFVDTCFHSIHSLFNFTQFSTTIFPSLIHFVPSVYTYLCVILPIHFNMFNSTSPGQFSIDRKIPINQSNFLIFFSWPLFYIFF